MPRTVVCQAPLSMGFPRQEYWSGLPFPSPGDLPDPGMEPMSLKSAALAGRFFITSTTSSSVSPSGFPGGSVVKNLPANAGRPGFNPWSGRSPGEGNGNPFQYSCLGNPMDRGAWRATAHGVAQSQTQLSEYACTRAHNHKIWKTGSHFRD